MVHTFLTGLCVLLAILSPIIYIVSIVRGATKPHRVTRFALMIVLFLTAASSYAAQGVTSAFILASIFAVQSVVVFALSIRKGVGGRSRSDIVCLAVVFLGILGWWLSGNAFVGLLYFVMADCAAFMPALCKTWQEPDTEGPWTYVLGVCSALCGMVTDGLAPFQMYLILVGCAMLVCIKREWLSRFVPFQNTQPQQAFEQE